MYVWLNFSRREVVWDESEVIGGGFAYRWAKGEIKNRFAYDCVRFASMRA